MNNEDSRCKFRGVYRYTWAGQPEALCCAFHGTGLSKVSSAMGYPLQMIPLKVHELAELRPCSSVVTEDSLLEIEEFNISAFREALQIASKKGQDMALIGCIKCGTPVLAEFSGEKDKRGYSFQCAMPDCLNISSEDQEGGNGEDTIEKP